MNFILIIIPGHTGISFRRFIVKKIVFLILMTVAVVGVYAGGKADTGSKPAAAPAVVEATSLTGAGATFPAVLYTKWFSEYAKLTKVEINYQGIGSGGGIKSISDQTVDFGASDGIMSADQLAAAKGGALLHIPMTMGGVVATYNIPELVGKDALKFTAETLSGMFYGDITKWNDPKLVADNPSLASIDKAITIVHRSDGSGTSNIWTSYLSAVNTKWAKEIGSGNSVNWPVGLGGKGNEGVAGNVKQTPYTVGYVELAYAKQNSLPYALLKNSAGNFIAATTASVSLAAQGVTLPDDMKIMLVNSSNPQAYPVSAFTWLLVYQAQTDAGKAASLSRMVWWALHSGQSFCSGLDYAPLPADAVKKAEVLLKSVTINGKPALPADVK